jgi:hypothetical protein
MRLGLVYLVFLPSIFTTPLAGGLVSRFGVQVTLWAGLAMAAAGLPLLLIPHLSAAVAGLVLVGIGTFLTQATATGFVGRIVMTDRGGGKRALSRQLLHWRARRQCRPGTGVRPLRLVRVRRRDRCIADACQRFDREIENAFW